MNWSSQLDCNILEVRIRKEICLGWTSKDWKMVCNVLVFSSEHEKSLSGWKYDSTCEWLIHSKGNVRYSVQSINIEQRAKPQYLGMHVKNGKQDKLYGAHQIRPWQDVTSCHFTVFSSLEPDSMLPKREDPGQTLRIYHCLFFSGNCLFDIAHFACCTQTDSLLPTREDMSQTSHIGRESADSALEYRGWRWVGMVIKISRDARRQEAGEGERLEDVRVRIVSVSRLLRYRLNYSSKPLADLLRSRRMGDVT